MFNVRDEVLEDRFDAKIIRIGIHDYISVMTIKIFSIHIRILLTQIHSLFFPTVSLLGKAKSTLASSSFSIFLHLNRMNKIKEVRVSHKANFFV